MVDRGEYDKAIFYAAEKLHGKKRKKTKHVKALEEAFYRVNQRDIDRISYLIAQENPENYDRIYDAYAVILNRQEKISPFLPLVSKDGYMAQFEFVEAASSMIKYGDLATAYHYDRALVSLAEAESGDKLAARRAFDRLQHTDKYTRHYKDKDALMKRAHDLGKTRVLLQMTNEAPVIMPENFEQHALAMNYAKLNSFWIEYFSGHIGDWPMDYRATLSLEDLHISPESEVVDRHRDEARVEDGFKWIEKKKEVGQDSLGNTLYTIEKVKKKKFKKVYADVIHIERHKQAKALASLTYLDLRTGEVLDVEPIRVTANFEEEGLDFWGDSRALCGKHIRTKRIVEDFPSDYEMTMIAARHIKNSVERHLHTFVF